MWVVVPQVFLLAFSPAWRISKSSRLEREGRIPTRVGGACALVSPSVSLCRFGQMYVLGAAASRYPSSRVAGYLSGCMGVGPLVERVVDGGRSGRGKGRRECRLPCRVSCQAGGNFEDDDCWFAGGTTGCSQESGTTQMRRANARCCCVVISVERQKLFGVGERRSEQGTIRKRKNEKEPPSGWMQRRSRERLKKKRTGRGAVDISGSHKLWKRTGMWGKEDQDLRMKGGMPYTAPGLSFWIDQGTVLC